MEICVSSPIILVPSHKLILHDYDVLPESGRALLLAFNTYMQSNKYQYMIPPIHVFLTIYWYLRLSSLRGVPPENVEYFLTELKLVRLPTEELTWFEHIVKDNCQAVESFGIIPPINVPALPNKVLESVYRKLSSKAVTKFVCKGLGTNAVLEELERIAGAQGIKA